MTNNIFIDKKIVAIVPAAGVGGRMGAAIPKQYLKIGPQTILEYTLNKLLSLSIIDHIIVAISQQDQWFSSLPVVNHPRIKQTYGGKTRSESVLSALKLVDEFDWVLVHDAVRPCVRTEDIEQLIQMVMANHQGGILATKISDTIKKVVGGKTVIESTIDRQFLWAAATPQMFNARLLKDAILKAAQNQIELTDESSAIEYIKQPSLVINCHKDNIKITQPDDLILAEFYLRKQGVISA